MRNLKKVLALVVAVAMIASMGLVASAASYSDVATKASYADAVNLLSNLGIITGYEDGTFRPDNTVTRAEAATMIVRMLGLADSAEMGETMFTDVAADNWASGYVNVAVANGIVNGMGDGTFAPNGEVTYGQIVKMIVCALGYEPVAQANGGWNGGGYILAGSKAGFTKGVAGTADAAASRATVAQLIYNALEIQIMDQTSFSTGINGSTYELTDDTILSKYLGLEKVEGVIVETYLSNYDYEDGNKSVDLVITKNYTDEELKPVYEAGDKVSFIADGTNAATLLGYSVVAYVGENEDDDDEMFAVAAKSGKNTMITLDTELVVKIGEILDKDGEEVLYDTGIEYYKSESAKSTTKAAIDNLITSKSFNDVDVENIVINGFNVNKYDFDAFDTDMYDAIDLLDNDGDGDFEFVFVTIADVEDASSFAEFVVEEVDVEEAMIYGEDDDLDLYYEEGDDMIITIIKDGAIVDLSAVEVGDVVTVLDTNAPVLTVNVSSVKVEGMIEEVEGDTYTINGQEYVLSGLSYEDDDTLAAGDEGVFYINATGKIAYNETKSTVAGADYVYVIAADDSTGDFDEMSYIVKVVTAEGKIEVLTVKSKKVTIDGVTGKTDEDVYDSLVEYGTGLAKIETSANGELSAIYFPGCEDFEENNKFAEENTKEYNEERANYSTIDLPAETLVFHKDSSEEDLEDAITVTTVGDLFEDGNSYKFVAYGEEEFETPDVIVAYDAATAVDDEAPVMVVTKVSTTTYDDESTLKITGLVAGETVSVIVDPEEDEVPAVEKGNVILYATTAGLATDVKVLFTSDEYAPGELGEDLGDIELEYTEDAVSVHYIEEYEDANKNKITVDEETVLYFDEDVNVTVVDYSYNNVSIKKGSVNDCGAVTRYTKTLFVKTTLDDTDVVTDVVVFIEK